MIIEVKPCQHCGKELKTIEDNGIYTLGCDCKKEKPPLPFSWDLIDEKYSFLFKYAENEWYFCEFKPCYGLNKWSGGGDWVNCPFKNMPDLELKGSLYERESE